MTAHGTPAAPEPIAYDVGVIGAGAAGLAAAIFAARAGRRVVLLESRPVPGAKIRVSGGGRCNVLPSRFEIDDFATEGSKHTLRKVLLSWPLDDVRRFFEEELRVPLKVEETGKLFPVSDRSRDVIEALLAECMRAGVDLRGGRRVTAVRAPVRDTTTAFEVETGTGERFLARKLILATGGLSLPKTGSDGFGLEIARTLGHSVRPTYPALVPLIARDPGWGELAGLSIRARLRALSGSRLLEEREGDLLFTHRGFSGPLALDLSRHFTRPGVESPSLTAAWLGGDAPDWDALIREPGKRPVHTILRGRLPRRLGERILALAGVSADRTTSDLPRADRAGLVRMLTACPLEIAGDEGYERAEVTGGGVPLEEVSAATLESRVVPGLHLAGEMLDVVGRIGGYNFLWAWVTGRKAGEGTARAVISG